jgi:hypothetical protein
MSTMVTELYEALRKAGVDEPTATAAARAVLIEVRTDLATKTDLAELKAATKTDLAELKADLTWRMVVMTGIFVAAVSALRIFS